MVAAQARGAPFERRSNPAAISKEGAVMLRTALATGRARVQLLRGIPDARRIDTRVAPRRTRTERLTSRTPRTERR